MRFKYQADIKPGAADIESVSVVFSAQTWNEAVWWVGKFHTQIGVSLEDRATSSITIAAPRVREVYHGL